MGLFVDTVSADVALPDLGITLTHPTTNYDLGGKFEARLISESTDLYAAITGGQLNWKKTSGGTILANADFDPDIVLADEANLGPGDENDRLVSFKDLTADNLTGASPGFTYGRTGTTGAGTWLQNETVPSNVVGRPIFTDNGKIIRVAVSNETSQTWTVEIYEHDQTTYTLLYTAAVTPAAKEKIFEGLNISITKGKQLAAKIADSSPNPAKNPLVTVSAKGDVT